jgi:3-methyladenine DNA glycosylase Tag
MEKEYHDTAWGIPIGEDRLFVEALLFTIPKKNLG